MSGTTPEGARTEAEASQWVRDMFGRVAPRYDLANHVLSGNIDRHWRARTVERVSHILNRPQARVLDLCCGTGDLMMELQRARAATGGHSTVMGSDFCHPMLCGAARKSPRAPLFEADALALPLADGSLDLITVGFGFRNLVNYEQGLRELRRVLCAGGMLAILEFSEPPNRLFRSVYHFYSRRILPLIGGWLSGSRDAYVYLPESVRKFPSAPHLAEMMRAADFRQVDFERMTGGIVALHLGQ